MWQAIKTFVLVSLVTVIIWAFAEAESLRSAEVRSVEVAVSTPANSKYIADLIQDNAPARTQSLRADVVIDGPAAALETVERILRSPIILSPGMEGFSTEPGRHTVDLQTILRSHPDLRLASRGVSIKTVSPETIDVRVDELVSRPIKVDVDVPGAELDGPPEVKTTSATITLPKSLEGKLTDSSAATARVEPAALARLNPGRKETVAGVRLVPPPDLAGNPRIRIEPAAVDVALTLRTKSATVKVPSVPVHIRIAPGELSKWDIEVPEQDRFLTDVTVTGPSEVIRQIQEKALPLVATVSLTFEELERMIPSKDAVFCDLPTGVRFDVANKTVRLKIKRREAQPAATPANPRPAGG
jgi:hypothetical protein